MAPGHPDAIASVPGRDYRDGRYETPRDALVAHIPADALDASRAYRELEAEMRAASFGAKIAWALGSRRRAVLHATIYGPFATAEAPRVADIAAGFAARHGAFALRLGGLFVGARNHGRLYLPVYPQRVAGDDPFGLLQDAIGRPRSRFYSVGLWHLADGLDAAEAAELAALVDKWRDRETAVIFPARLAILRVHDDLALDGASWVWNDSPAGR